QTSWHLLRLQLPKVCKDPLSLVLRDRAQRHTDMNEHVITHHGFRDQRKAHFLDDAPEIDLACTQPLSALVYINHFAGDRQAHAISPSRRRPQSGPRQSRRRLSEYDDASMA